MLRNLIALLLLCWPGLGLASGPHTLAVLYFENGGGAEYDALKVGLTQMLINDLVGTDGVTVVERTALQAILDELELGHSGVADPDTAAKVGKLLGAEWLVMGTYFELGGQLFVQSRIVRVETGEILAAHSLQDEPARFLELERKLALAWDGTLEGLTTRRDHPPEAPAPAPTRGDATSPAAPSAPAAPAAPAAAAEEAGTLAKPDPKALDAAIAFSEGLIYLDTKDLPRAREAFEQAVAADPRLDDAKAQLAAIDL